MIIHNRIKISHVDRIFIYIFYDLCFMMIICKYSSYPSSYFIIISLLLCIIYKLMHLQMGKTYKI